MNVADLKKYKDNCYSALSRDLTEFEKNFLLIASGILAFSTTFIKDVVRVSDTHKLPILFAAWFFIIASIGIMMYAFLKSASSSDRLLNAVDKFEIRHCLFQDTIELSKEQWNEIRAAVALILRSSKASLKKQRNSAVICFLIGIILLSLFVSINLFQQQNQNSTTSQKELKSINQSHE